MTTLENHMLYYRESCPFCQKVLRFMKSRGIECGMRDVLNPGVYDELIAIGGKQQVPCLVIDGKALYESSDIVAYLRQKIA